MMDVSPHLPQKSLHHACTDHSLVRVAPRLEIAADFRQSSFEFLRHGSSAAGCRSLPLLKLRYQSVTPSEPKFMFGMEPPDGRAGVHDPNDCAHSFRLGAEISFS